MADMDHLGGLAAEILRERREFQDPWGIVGFSVRGEVRRADLPDWQQHLLQFEASRSEEVEKQRAIQERLLHPLAPKGFRQSKKLSEAEAHNRLIASVAKLNHLQIAVLRLREQKEGIAALLCTRLRINGEGTIQRGGRSFDLDTPEGRRGIFDHALWEFEQDGEKLEVAVPFFRKGPDGDVMLDDQGEPLRHDLAGWNLGDALAQLILQEAEDSAKFVQKRRAALGESSAGTVTGSTGAGSAFQSDNDE